MPIKITSGIDSFNNNLIKINSFSIIIQNIENITYLIIDILLNTLYISTVILN